MKRVKVFFIKIREEKESSKDQDRLRYLTRKSSESVRFERLAIRQYLCHFPPSVVTAEELYNICAEIATKCHMVIAQFIVEWEVGRRTFVATASDKERLESLFEPLFFNTEGLSARQKKAASQLFLDRYFAAKKQGDHQLASFLEARAKTLS